jgi:hypothetical protein
MNQQTPNKGLERTSAVHGKRASVRSPLNPVLCVPLDEGAVFVIESAHGATRLEFHGEIPLDSAGDEGFEMRVRLYGGGVDASERVYDHLAYRWAEFFAGLARDWRGWDGERAVESLEGQLKVSCTADRLGHLALRVEMRGDPSGSDWRAIDTISLEAGQLEDIAYRAKQHFGEERRFMQDQDA